MAAMREHRVAMRQNRKAGKSTRQSIGMRNLNASHVVESAVRSSHIENNSISNAVHLAGYFVEIRNHPSPQRRNIASGCSHVSLAQTNEQHGLAIFKVCWFDMRHRASAYFAPLRL